MRAMNCQNVRRLIEEIELDERPSVELRDHLEFCPSCQRFYQEQVKLRQMIGALETVAAPSDFDFRLRARLAANEGSLRTPFSGLSFRSAALTTLAVLLVAAFSYRILLPRPATPTTAQIDSGSTSKASEKMKTVSEVASTSPSTDQGLNNIRPSGPVNEPKPVRLPIRKLSREATQTRNVAASSLRIVSKDFSSLAAGVVRPAGGDGSPIFAIDASNQSMKLSLDDSSGAVRTISLPRVSFGSQRVLAGETTSMVRTSAKGIW